MQLEDILKKNVRLKGLHAGKRCFLVGNGPSIKSQDLTVLKDEVTIVASSFFRHPDAKLIDPAYWVLADPFFWQRADEHLTPALKPVLDLGLAPKLFLPSGAFNFFVNFNRGPLVDLHFFHYDNQFDYARDHGKTIDLSKPVPPFGQNVMIVALMLAYHLGCNPIYFIGCDHDFYNITEETYQSSTIDHFYPTANASGHTQVLNWQEWKWCMESMDFQYRSLKSYGDAHGFSVFNATRGGYLETFPRVEYEALFSAATKTKPGEGGDPLELCPAAKALMEASDHQGALVLLDEAIRRNLNRQPKVDGLEYLKALCLTTMGRPHEALVWARQDYHCNPANRPAVEPLIRRLESFLS